MSNLSNPHDVPQIPEPWSTLFGFSRRAYAYELRSDAIGFKLSDGRLSAIEERRLKQQKRRDRELEYMRRSGMRTTAQVAQKEGINTDLAFKDLSAMRKEGTVMSVTIGGVKGWMVVTCST